VRAESGGKDQGATFTVILPIPAVLLFPEEPVMAPSSSPPKAETIPPTFDAPAPERNLLVGTRVLVVDDEVDARDALVGLLERYGAAVRSADSVVEAMVALRQSLPDVLVSDLGMPGADGYELIRQLRLLPADAGGQLPALAVSAYATDEHRKRVMKTGFQCHLAKPVAAAELVITVARLAGRPSATALD
jgi:CheY-like chemotaxis protein